MNISVIPHNSVNYQKAVKLRDKVLRKPLGLVFTESELEAESSSIHVAAIDKDEVVGILVLKPMSDSEIKMRQVAVEENLRGSGIGRKMVGFAEKVCQGKGYTKITLHAREEPVKFYKRLNYEQISIPFYEVGILHYKMYKNI